MCTVLLPPGENPFAVNKYVNISIHFVFNKFFPPKIVPCMWRGKILQSRTGHRWNIIWRMRFACWITKAMDTHSEYVKRIAFPLQQWLHERARMLRYTYIAWHVYSFSCKVTFSNAAPICVFFPCVRNLNSK